MAVLKFGLSLFAASILGISGSMVLEDTALAASRSAKQSTAKGDNASSKRKCKIKGVRAKVRRELCRVNKLPVRPKPAPAGLCDGRQQMACIQIYKPVHIFTEKGCRTFGNACSLSISQEFCGQQLEVREGACPGE